MILLTAVVFNLIFGFVRNPVHVENTLSWIGYDYPMGFAFWGALTGGAYFINIFQLYENCGYTGKIGTISLYAAPFMAVIVVLINDWGWEGTVHLTAALAYIAMNGISLAAFFLKNFTKHISYKITLFIIAATLVGMIITYFAADKSGLLEIAPLLGGLILLLLANHTKIYPVTDRAESDEKTRDGKRAAKLAMYLGMFGADDFYLGRYPQGAGHLLMTYTGALICAVRFIGMGSINDIKGENAAVFLAVGLSVLGGSAAWAIYNGAVLEKTE